MPQVLSYYKETGHHIYGDLGSYNFLPGGGAVRLFVIAGRLFFLVPPLPPPLTY